MSSAAVFWDRDKTLIEDPGYISDPGQVKLLPGAAEALRRLAELHADRGDAGRAKACRSRLAEIVGQGGAEEERPDPASDEPPPEPPGEPGSGDLVRFVHLFGGREGVHARQWAGVSTVT